MHSNFQMATALVLVALAAPARSQDASADPAGAPASDRIAKSAKLYDKACAICHVPPDPAKAMDRAWITQLLDTA